MPDYPNQHSVVNANHTPIGTQSWPFWLAILSQTTPPETIFNNKGVVISNDNVNSCDNVLTYSDLSEYSGDPLKACSCTETVYACGYEDGGEACDSGGTLNCQEVSGSCGGTLRVTC